MDRLDKDWKDPELAEKYYADQKGLYVGNGCEISIFPNRGSLYCKRCSEWFFGEVLDHIETTQHHNKLMVALSK